MNYLFNRDYENCVYFNDMLHAVLKSKNLQLFEKMDDITKKFVEKREFNTNTQLKKIRKKVVFMK